MLLDENQKQEAKEIYDRLMQIYKEKVDFEMLKKERETRLKDELANALDIRNKDGIVLANKIKIPLVLAVIDELIYEKENRKESEYDTMESYKNAIKTKKVSEVVVSDYAYILDELDGLKQSVKEIFSDSSLLDKDMLKAIDEIAKAKFKEIMEDKMIETGTQIKPPKDNSEFYEVKSEIQNFLMGENNEN